MEKHIQDVTVDSSAENRSQTKQFKELYDKFYEDIWKYCLRRSGSDSDAEDVLSETFTIAWQKFDDIPKYEEARLWLFGVARNQLRGSWRTTKRRKKIAERLTAEAPTNSHAIDPADEATYNSKNVLQELAALKEKDREIILLACWEKLSHQEIAQILGCSENAVGIRSHRAKEKLKSRLEKNMKDPRPQKHVLPKWLANTKGASK